MTLTTLNCTVKDKAHVTKKDLETAERIIQLYSSHYNVPVEIIKGPRIHDDISALRDEIIYRLRTELWLTFDIIGELLGNRTGAAISLAFKRYYKQEVLQCPENQKSRKFRKTWKPYE